MQIQVTHTRVFDHFFIPIGSMYGIFTYIWLIFMVHVGKYTIHGSYGIYIPHSLGETSRTGARGLTTDTASVTLGPTTHTVT